MSEQMLKPLDISPLVAVVDIETNAKCENAQILTIGAVIVDVAEGVTVAEFYQRVELESQPDRVSCFDTISFWMETNKTHPVAYKEAFSTDLLRYPLKSVLAAFNNFLSVHFGNEKRQVMGNGPEFDNVILAHAFEQCGLKPAWHYGANQSLRTAVWMGRLLLGIDPKTSAMSGTKHHALDDARHEARYLLDIMQAFKAKLER